MSDEPTREPAREPRVLDVVEQNLCGACGTTLVFLRGVGWVHVERIHCARPTPRLHRCGVCDHLVYAYPGTGRLRDHPVRIDGLAVAGALCAGGLRPGIAPLADPGAPSDPRQVRREARGEA